ncbi:exodeoxyribonuclease VII large subunit [Stackebrandtia soli]|uniref:exodeoxyribonuclease VII large subunit n=1 Tax=Stackebrandtia soli TaxID=1892856 RepID=UPI0039E9F832
MTQPEARTGPTSPEEPWPVRVASQKIGDWISRLGTIWIEGQVTQISRRPGAAMVFLTLRDPAAEISLSVVTTRHVVDASDVPLRDGARVIIHGKPDWYAGRGTLSIRAIEIRQVGLGELLARLERLKRLLNAEGLFAAERKRPLPFLPHRIGLITGRASAALRDVVENARKRLPSADFAIREVAVQGATAVTSVIEALNDLDTDPEVDVIILARGGGSVEDLLPFSDETLCRAVFACRTPVVSAIGHEPDNPLVDLVADVRCSTPTDAGKRVVPDFAEERRGIAAARQRLRQAVRVKLDREEHGLTAMRSRPCLARPERFIEERANDVTIARQRIRRAFRQRLDTAGREVEHARSQLRALSPKGTLDRGYAIVRHVGGGVVTDAAEVKHGEELTVRLATGELSVTAKD